MGHGTGRLIWCVNFTGSCYRQLDIQRVRQGIMDAVQTFQQYEMPATWMMPDPAALHGVCRSILERQGQSVGLLAAEWANGQRHELAMELSRRIERARARGIEVATLAANRFENHLDLLVRHKISAVRLDCDEANVSSRRFGIWQASTTEMVPGKSGLWGGRFAYQRLLSTAARNHQTIVLTVNGDRVVSEPQAAAVFRAVCRSAARSSLRIQGFAEVGRRMVSANIARPARSILRAA